MSDCSFLGQFFFVVVQRMIVCGRDLKIKIRNRTKTVEQTRKIGRRGLEKLWLTWKRRDPGTHRASTCHSRELVLFIQSSASQFAPSRDQMATPWLPPPSSSVCVNANPVFVTRPCLM
jgi:hypothetical protein